MKVNYYVAFKINGAWTDDFAFERPLFSDKPLDETLDTAIIVDVPTSLKDIPPFTLCRIIAKNASTNTRIGLPEFYWTGDREASAVTMFKGNGELSDFLINQKYTQKINLIELTKILERVPCDSLSFTHRLRKNLFPNADYVDVVFNGDGTNNDFDHSVYPLILSPEATGATVFLGKITSMFTPKEGNTIEDQLLIDGSWRYSGVSVNCFTGDDVVNVYSHTGINNDDSFVAAYNGTYIIRWTIVYTHQNPPPHGDSYRVIYPEAIITVKSPGVVAKDTPSITDVINRILSVASPRPIYKDQYYKLDGMLPNGNMLFSSFAYLYSKVAAPEFFFPRMTLFEALLEVGKKIHAIPRLTVDDPVSDNAEPNKITYDLLGTDEEYHIPSSAIIVGYKNSQGMEDYCGALDSYVENHINTVDPNAGTITEPYDGGYKTLRCESGVQIKNATAVFEATRPIYRVVKFEMAYTKKSTGTVIGDITDFLYEQAEYDGLFTSDTASYPNSVSHALVWKQGDRYIRGFDTASSSLLNIIEEFAKPSIANIVKDKKGDNYFDVDERYGDLAFRLTYIPMDSLRLRQYKPYQTHPSGNLLYNQQNANTVEASYYGESLKGKIARMGNVIEVFTIQYNSPSDLPRIGNILVDEQGDSRGYIYKITTQKERNFVVADVYVTPDFNRLSEYFSLESNFRLFEVSERQSIDRQVMISRIIKVALSGSGLASNEPHFIGGGLSYNTETNVAMSRFMGTFIAGKTNWQNTIGVDNTKRANVAVVRLIKDAANNYEQIGDYCFTFPVNSTACGNSLAFSFGFEDSYSAGSRAAAGGIVENRRVEWKQRKNSPYGNNFGEFWGMEFAIGKILYESYLDGGYTEYRQHTPAWQDQSIAGGFDDSFPTITQDVFSSTMNHSFFSTKSFLAPVNDPSDPDHLETGVRVIDKNSSEKISVTLQFHGQAIDKKIVFGSAMWNNNLLIRDDPIPYDSNPNNASPHEWARTPHVYGIKGKKLNMLRNYIDLENTGIYYDCGAIQSVSWSTILGIIGSITIPQFSGVDEYDPFTAWCIADSVTGEIYIGVNETVTPGQRTSPIYFSFDTEA